MNIIPGRSGKQLIDITSSDAEECLNYIAASSADMVLHISRKNSQRELVLQIARNPARFQIRELSLMGDVENIEEFQQFYWLVGLNIGFNNSRFEFGSLKSLRSLGGIWSRHWSGLQDCKALTEVHLSGFDGTISGLPNVNELQKITLIQPNCTSLEGIGNAGKLSDFEVALAKRLESIDELDKLANTLVSLSIDGCRSIRSYNAVGSLAGLMELSILDSAALDSLSILERMTALRSLRVVGTKINNRDLTPCIQNASLKEFRCERRSGYKPSVNEVIETLRSR